VGRDPAAFGLTLGAAPASTGQAEFTANHLGAFDSAMSDAERHSAIAAYRAFAAQVNEVRTAEADQTAAAASGSRFRLADADVDIALTANTAQLFNWRKHRGWSVPRGIAVLAARLGGSTFDRRTFLDLAGGEHVGGALWNALVRMGVIEAAAP
jgi:hypothetical protein